MMCIQCTTVCKAGYNMCAQHTECVPDQDMDCIEDSRVSDTRRLVCMNLINCLILPSTCPLALYQGARWAGATAEHLSMRLPVHMLANIIAKLAIVLN